MKSTHIKFDFLVICFTLLCINVSCSKDNTVLHNPMIDLGIDEIEAEIRLKTSLVGQRPDGEGNPENLCNDGKMQLMSDDPFCGYVDVGEYGINQINEYRAKHGLPAYIRAIEYELCAAREARLAAQNNVPHYSDGCGWKSQGSAGGGRGGNDSEGTVKKSVWWVPKLFYDEGPNGGHYQAMMENRSRAVAVGYYAIDRDKHAIIVNYYDEL